MKNIVLDNKQKEILDICTIYIKNRQDKINISQSSKILDSVKNFFGDTKRDKQGIYLHGTVGTGKTMIMSEIYTECSKNSKGSKDSQDNIRLLHFQNFMQETHLVMHEIREGIGNKESHNSQKQQKMELMIPELVDKLIGNVKYLFIDEFEVKDITDAMLIMQLFDYLLKKDIFIFLTTNTQPRNLYKDGLQRESFLPFIDTLEKNFLILTLNNKDYRYSALDEIKNKRILSKATNDDSPHSLEKIKTHFCPDKKHYLPTTLKVFDREVIFAHTYKGVLFTNFQELFEQNFSYADYKTICNHFNVIIIDSIPAIDANDSDTAIRVMNFIDQVYFYKILLFTYVLCDIKDIYSNNVKLKEFNRAISRIHEMNADTYLQLHINKNTQKTKE